MTAALLAGLLCDQRSVSLKGETYCGHSIALFLTGPASVPRGWLIDERMVLL